MFRRIGSGKCVVEVDTRVWVAQLSLWTSLCHLRKSCTCYDSDCCKGCKTMRASITCGSHAPIDSFEHVQHFDFFRVL